MRLCTVWLDSETCSRARRGESTRGERCSRLNEASSVLEQSSHAIFTVLASSCEDASPLETTSPSCREDRFRHPCCDHMGECAFQESVVVRREVSVSMSSFCCSSHKQLEASTSLEATSTHGQRSCFRAVLSSILSFLVLVTRSEVLRDGSIAISAVHCLRGQVSRNGLFRGCENARCLFILALSTFCGTNGFPLFCTSASWILSFGISFASDWQRVLCNRHRDRKMMTRSSSRCISATVGDGRMVALQS